MGKKSRKPKASKAAPTRQRLSAIDMMVGMAMIFVVMGHMSVGYVPDWYSNGLHNWIYSFHMELFVFLSAFIIRYSYKGVKSPLEYGLYIWRKFKKFFLWFIIIGMTVSLMACLIKDTTFSSSYLLDSLRTILLYPRRSEASFLWYIYILFGYYLISPLFFRLPQWAKVLCCIAAMFLPMLNAGHFLAGFDFCQYTFFYCLGVLCAEWIEEIKSIKIWQWGLFSLPFIAFSGWIFTEGMYIGFEFPQLGWWSLVTGTASLPFFYLVALALQKISFVNKILTFISKDCYWIYLFQMFIIWGVATMIKKMGLIDSVHFVLFFIVATILAILIPVLVAEVVKSICKKRGPLTERPAKNTSLK